MGGTLHRVSFILAMNQYTVNDVTAAGTSGAPELLGSAYKRLPYFNWRRNITQSSATVMLSRST